MTVFVEIVEIEEAYSGKPIRVVRPAHRGRRPIPLLYEQLFGWDVADVPAEDTKVPMVGGEQPWASIVADGSDGVSVK